MSTSNSSNLVLLYTIPDGKYFRIQGRRAEFLKRDSCQTIAYQDYLPDGTAVVSSKPGCDCKASNGRTFVKGWYDWVEEVL